MRNLQKILALVLALMMSVSLVATAGAFSDDGDITDVYKDAVTVLNGLDVFKGYDNGATFQPKGNITRAEVAAIIYRIATGDVTDSQASIYSTYGQFTDVADGSWYSGYVNYCANAGYIKGRGNKIFDPQGQVTGYEALAMILRAVGYDKNGEFTGSNWQIRTASIANERGITKNVTSAQLGQAATRETVAEILFRSIVIPKVNFNANTLSYTEKPLNADGKKDTLGYESLKLEEITGIVTANEYADLDNSVTLNTDKTRMRVSGVDGGNYILDYGEATLLEGLDAIGEEHNAYIQNANTTSAKVLLMAKTDNNKTYETLEKVEIDTDSKFREKTGLQRSETATEHYLNFDEVKDWRSDWRIKYVISSVNTVANTIDEVNREISRINANTNFELPTLANLNADTLARAGYALIPDGTTGRFFIEYTKEFRVDTTIGSVDRGNIEEIFNIADRLTKNDYVRGEVYVGTSSLKDISDEISYKQFVEQYINNDGDKKITKNENGNWLKVIDNDNDGQADYVLKVVYTMAQVVRASGGEYGLDTEDLNLCSWNRASYDESVNFLDDDDVVSEDTLALDDIVYYAVIDGVPRATKAETATVKIDTVNRKDLRVTTTDSVEYVESGVCEEIDSDDYTSGVTNMNGSATYDIYLDRGGYLAAFTDSHGGDFTLIVDGWYNSTKGGIEYAVRAYNDETGRQDVVDVTRGGGMFIGRDVQWTDQVDNNDWRALKWLGGTKDTEALTNRVTATGTYGAGKLNGEGYANTNDVKTTVATLTDDGMIQPVDYTSVGSKVVRMLATKDNEIPDSSASYQAEVYETSSSLSATDTAYNRLESGNAELRALSTTVYYLVYPSKNAETGFAVEKYTGYASVPSVDDGFIEDVYAVGTLQERNSTLGGKDYYTANVVVVELKSTFRGYAEQVFIYNMPEAGNRVGIESVDLIHENGENETGVKIDFALSNVRDYRVAHNVNSSIWENTHWRPGLYYLYPTNTADLYTVQPMDANDIAQNDYVVGWSSTSDATAKTDHVSVIAFSNDVHVGGANIEIAYGEVTKAVSNVYRIGYDSKGIADLSTYKLDEGNLLSFVDERVDVTSGVNTYDYNKYDHYPYDRDNHPNACDICWNQNLILMHYTGNTANYTISFENDNSLAEDVWSNNMPSTLAWNDAADVNKNLSRDDAVSYAQFMLKCADPVNDANGLPTNVYYNARYHIDQAVKTAMAGTLEVKKNRVDSVADNLITQLKGGTTDPDPAKYNAAADAYNAAKAATPDLANAELTVLENIKTLIQTAKNDPSYSKLSQTQKDNLDAWETEVQTAIDSKDTIKVTVQFVDESGNPVTGLADFTKDGEAGAQMEIPLTVAGYTVVSVDNGTLNADKTAVIITPAADATVKVTVKAETSEEEKYVLTFAPTLKDGTFDVTVNGVIAADGAEISKGDVIALNPARVLDITGVDENGAVTGNVTVSIKEGFTWSNMFGGWMGVNDNGDLITIPYNPTAAAARVRARAANDSAADWPVGPVDTNVEGWFAKMVRDYGATYTITVGNVVWEGKITEGGTTWKLVSGSVEEAKAAVMDIDTSDVEKTGVAPEVPEDLDAAKAAAVETINGYESEKIARLGDEDKAAAEAAKADALKAVEDATTVEEVNAAVEAYKTAIDALVAEPAENKLVVEPVTGRTTLIEGDSMIAANIQEGIQVVKQADGTTYNVTGNVFYTKDWTAYNSTHGSGYFVALKITHPDVDSSMIMLNRGTAPFENAATSKYLDDDGILVYKAAIKDNKADSFTVTVMLDDGTREVSTIDLSGLTLGEDTSELTVEAVDPNGKDAVQWGVDVADLQSNVTVDPAENGVIKVHGTAKYFDDSSKSDWTTGWSESLRAGYFVALKLNFPGVVATETDGINIFYTDANGNPVSPAARHMSDGDILLWRIKPSTAMKPINNVKVEVEGKTYTIDISDVILRGTAMTLSAVTDDSIDLLKKKASDLQSDIVVSGPAGNRFTVTGTSKYVSGWTGFSSVSGEQSGNFVALQISWPGVQNDQIDYGWDTANKNADYDGLFVFRLQNGDGAANQPMKIMKFKANGITYEVDLSGITREPDTENGLVIDRPRDNESTDGDGGVVSDYNVEPVSVDGYTVSGGRLGYQEELDSDTPDSHGYYVALYVTEGSDPVTKIYWREVGSSGDGEAVTAKDGVCLLPVKVGKDMFRNNEQYTSLEIAPDSSGSADWNNSVTVDLSGLTNLGVAPTAESYPEDEDFTLGDLDAPGSTYQTITTVSGPDENNVITVEGSLNWIDPNDAYGSDEDSGYYGIIRFKVDPKVVSVFTLRAIHESEGTPDGSATTGWKSIPVDDGFLDLMTHVASWSGETPENTVLYVDGVKYEINWNVTLNPQPMPASALD